MKKGEIKNGSGKIGNENLCRYYLIYTLLDS